MHCRYCDKCILRLDHHCFFVNNCIGKANYKVYLITLILAFLYCCITSTLSCLFFINGGINVREFTGGQIVVLILSALLSLNGFTGIGFTGNLIILHVKLYKRKETTLEYSRYLREQYLASLNQPEEANKVGFWKMFYSCKAISRGATVPTDNEREDIDLNKSNNES